MKKLLILGSNGLLGQNLVKKFYGKGTIYAASYEDENYLSGLELEYKKTDLSSRTQTRDLIEEVHPDIIINAAAFTNVDRSEEERELCWSVNVKAIENIIEASVFIKPILVHISTDYVFDGTNGGYTENDKPHPRGNYARSKLAAENIISASELEYIILRTQVLYGYGVDVRPNFVTWVIDELRNKKNIRIVSDQIGNPTYAPDVCEAAYRLLEKKAYGLFHVSSPDTISRYDFALKICREFELDSQLIERIKTNELNQKAPRPMNSSFKINKLVNNAGWEPHSVQQALRLLKKELEAANG